MSRSATRFLRPMPTSEPEHIVIQLTGQLAVEIAQLQILDILRPRFGELAAQTQAVRQPEMRLGGLRILTWIAFRAASIDCG